MSFGDRERFGGIVRLFGPEGMDRLAAAHACVVGIGGVGVWAVESLARTGIGHLTLIDLDDLCVTNVNRQLHALEETVGRSKIEVMEQRIRSISPACEVHLHHQFLTPSNARNLVVPGMDVVVDAIDAMDAKCSLLATCRAQEIPVVTCGGAGGKREAAKVRVKDLTMATNDRLLRRVRKVLRRDHGFSRDPNAPFGIPAVYCEEDARLLRVDGSVVTEAEEGVRISCDAGLGTASFVTGTVGLLAAGEAVRLLLGETFR
ncbi:MAG: tRNA threonylcarbamoyladenosine dehydratase [Verrucomicrobiota bacterium]